MNMDNVYLYCSTSNKDDVKKEVQPIGYVNTFVSGKKDMKEIIKSLIQYSVENAKWSAVFMLIMRHN